jgi:stage V sporulation protein AB
MKEEKRTMINVIVQAVIGFSAGAIIAAGVFSFITTIGIITRIAGKTGTGEHIRLYEDCIVIGAAIGNWVNIVEPNLRLGKIGAGIFGGFSGIFVGCLIMSLAETIDTIPVIARNVKMKRGIQYVILAMAVGKTVGAFLCFYYGI